MLWLMRLDNFSSEFTAQEVPDLNGARVTNTDLDIAVEQVPEHERVELSQQNLILGGIKDFYFAKYFIQQGRSADYAGDDGLQETFKYLSHQLMKQAIISVATTIDLTAGKPVKGQRPPGRTASLPHLLEKIQNTLKGLDTDASAELDLIAHIRSAVNTEKHLQLRYVQYMRNKWAGHASLDLKFDTWAQADESLSISNVEAALVRIVNAYEDFSDLIGMSESLLEKTKKPKQLPTIDADGNETWKMLVDWSNIRTLAPLIRESTKNEADHFLKSFATPSD